MTRWLRVAFLCGLLPLCVGICVFVAWGVTRAPWLEFAGLVTLAAGTLLAIAGLLATAIYAIGARRRAVPRWRAHAGTAVAVILANFPVALAILAAVNHMFAAYVVSVDNLSSHAIEQLTIDSAQGHYVFGNVPARSRASRTFRFDGEGAVTFAATWNGHVQSGTLDGYVSGNGGARTIRVGAAGDVRVIDTHTGKQVE